MIFSFPLLTPCSPVADDILTARLKTLGVVEHTFKLKAQNERQQVDWKIFDVGGSRNQRQAWAPYFGDGTFAGRECDDGWSLIRLFSQQ